MLLDYYPSIDDEQHSYFFDEDEMFRSQGNFYPTGNYGITQQQAQYQDFAQYNTINTESESRSPQQHVMSAWNPTSGSSGAMPDWQGQVSMASYMQATNQQHTNSMTQYGEADEYSGLCTTVAQAINRAVPNAMMSHHQWMRSSTYRFNPSTGKTRTKDKYRVVYTDHQRLELEKEFRFSRYITIRRKSELAASLGLSERQVKIWFQNRRAKERKQSKKQGVSTTSDAMEPKQNMTKQTIGYAMDEVNYAEHKEMARNLPPVSYRMEQSATVIKEEPISNQPRTSCLKSL